MTTKTEGEGGNDKNDTWLEATDWDNPWNVALLYKNVKAKECGHAVQWIPHRLVDSKTCPVCQEPVSYICNGVAGTSTSPAEDPFVCFKFGKQIYRLTLKRETQQQQSQSWLSKFLNKWSTATTSSSTHTIVAAQDRIQSALNLADGFKILHKGKVLYTSYSKSDSDSFSPTELSQRLVEISHQDEQSSSPSLIVMGTLLGRELPPRPPDPTSTYSWTWYQLVQLPFAIMYWGMRSTWLFARTFLAPFLPPSLLRDSETRPRIQDDDERPHRE